MRLWTGFGLCVMVLLSGCQSHPLPGSETAKTQQAVARATANIVAAQADGKQVHTLTAAIGRDNKAVLFGLDRTAEAVRILAESAAFDAGDARAIAHKSVVLMESRRSRRASMPKP